MKDSGLFIAERYVYGHRSISKAKPAGINIENLSSEIDIEDLNLRNWGQIIPPDEMNKKPERK